MAYSFGAGTGETAESLKRKRAYVMALLEGAMGGGSNTVGEGISTIGRALVGRAGKAVLDKREREGTASAMSAASSNPMIKALLLGDTGGMPAPASRPSPAGHSPAGREYFDAIRSAESGGNDNAKNPLSSATGRYQFTSGTWNELARNKPELGLTPDGRTNPDQQERAIRAFTADNARVLASAGIEPTGGNLYAAHFLGAGGARSVLSQPDSASVAAIVGPSVVKANPFLRGMSVGDFRQWSARKGGGNNTLQGGEGNDMLDPIQTAGVTVGLKTPDAGPAPMQRPMPDDSRFGPAAAPKADRLPQPGAFNPMQASGPMAPPGMMEQAIIQRAAQSMPQQMRQPAPPQQQPPQPMQPDPMQTAAVPRPQPRMPMSQRGDSAGYSYGPGGQYTQAGGAPQAPQGGGLLARLLMRQPMPQGGGQAPQGNPQAAPQQGDDMIRMYQLLDSGLLPDGYRDYILEALKQRREQNDPMYQADLAYKQGQVEKMRNPGDPDLLSPEALAQKQALAAAGKPETNVNVGGEPGDGELRKSLDKKTGETWAKYQEVGATSGAMAQDMEMLDELIKIAPQGPLQGRLAEAFPGFSSAGAAFNSIVKRVAPSMRAEGSGSTSDIEYDGMLRSLPNLANMPEANAVISQMIKSKAQLNMERARIVDAYGSGDITASYARKMMAELDKRSIMTPEMKKLLAGITPANIQDDEGYSVKEVR